MQNCKSCLKPIVPGAIKCPYCQAYQVWYKNPQHYALLLMLPFIIFLYWNMGLGNKKEFIDYESEFTFTRETVVPTNDDKWLLITYKVKNNTQYKWDDINYEIISRSNGELLAAESMRDYTWVIQPNSESYLSVEVKIIPNANEWELNIKNLEVKRY